MISRTAGEIQRGLEQFHPPVPPFFVSVGWNGSTFTKVSHALVVLSVVERYQNIRNLESKFFM